MSAETGLKCEKTMATTPRTLRELTHPHHPIRVRVARLLEPTCPETRGVGSEGRAVETIGERTLVEFDSPHSEGATNVLSYRTGELELFCGPPRREDLGDTPRLPHLPKPQVLSTPLLEAYCELLSDALGRAESEGRLRSVREGYPEFVTPGDVTLV